ncbi:MAG: mechanosensitive ion channel family protein [Actinomycetota bacterium]|nr:mechanosensitive ion channel family protein [Actinomycetota bacterium]
MPVFAQDLSPVVEGLIRTGVVITLAFLAYWVALHLGRRVVREMSEKGEDSGARAQTLWIVARRVILVAIVISAVLIIFVIWDFSIIPFLAVGTVFAAAVGFGAQDLVKDIISGFFILVEDQFHIGDTVTIAGTTGSVEDIQLRVTVLRDLEGSVHFVPNGQITVTSNYTSRFAQPVIDVGVSYETDVDFALSVLKDELALLAGDPEWSASIKGEGEILGVNELADSSVVLRGRITTIADERWRVRREALRRIKKRFDAEGITIPFPQITVHEAD